MNTNNYNKRKRIKVHTVTIKITVSSDNRRNFGRGKSLVVRVYTTYCWTLFIFL